MKRRLPFLLLTSLCSSCSIIGAPLSVLIDADYTAIDNIKYSSSSMQSAAVNMKEEYYSGFFRVINVLHVAFEGGLNEYSLAIEHGGPTYRVSLDNDKTMIITQLENKKLLTIYNNETSFAFFISCSIVDIPSKYIVMK